MNNVIADTKTISGVKLLEVEIKRDSSAGLKIYLQSSSQLWQPFAREDGSTCTIGGVKCFRPKMEQLQGVPGYFLVDNIFEMDNMPNLNLLLATNIDNGVEFDFGKRPISEKKLEEWVVNIKKQVKIIYLSLIKPVDIRVVISSQTVEKEFHD